MHLDRLFFFILTGATYTAALPPNFLASQNGLQKIGQNKNSQDAASQIRHNNLTPFCNQILKGAGSGNQTAAAISTTTVTPQYTVTSQTVSPIAIAIVSTGTKVINTTVDVPATTLTNISTITTGFPTPTPQQAQAQALGKRNIISNIASQIVSDIRQDITTEVASRLGSFLPIVTLSTSTRRGEERREIASKRSYGVNPHDQQLNIPKPYQKEPGNVDSNVNYNVNNGNVQINYNINGVQVPKELLPYDPRTILTACSQVVNPGVVVPQSTNSTETSKEKSNNAQFNQPYPEYRKKVFKMIKRQGDVPPANIKTVTDTNVSPSTTVVVTSTLTNIANATTTNTVPVTTTTAISTNTLLNQTSSINLTVVLYTLPTNLPTNLLDLFTTTTTQETGSTTITTTEKTGVAGAAGEESQKPTSTVTLPPTTITASISPPSPEGTTATAA